MVFIYSFFDSQYVSMLYAVLFYFESSLRTSSNDFLSYTNRFSYTSRKALLDRVAFGVSRSTLRQQDTKVNVGRLKQRMASLRARAVELVGEAFSGGAEDPTALQLQADELYGMEEVRIRLHFWNYSYVHISLNIDPLASKIFRLLLHELGKHFDLKVGKKCRSKLQKLQFTVSLSCRTQCQ